MKKHIINGTEYVKAAPVSFHPDGIASCEGCALREEFECFIDDNHNCFDNDCIMKEA